jgi:type II secretory ATPase GspE/PulE/Tfp pilus assembly ATPase PilB-like protein
VLEGVLAQRLVRRICPTCRVSDIAAGGRPRRARHRRRRGTRLYRGSGCDEGRGTGYRGRTGIYELFSISEDARSLILRRAPTREHPRAALEAGMVTLAA